MSEIFASMLMIGATLTTGALVVAAAMGQAGLENAAASSGAAAAQYTAGVQLALIYLVVNPSSSCPVFAGNHEGTNLTFAIYDYGSQSFSPAFVAVNGSEYFATYAPVAAGGLVVFDLHLGACAHASGQTLLVADGRGSATQFAS